MLLAGTLGGAAAATVLNTRENEREQHSPERTLPPPTLTVAAQNPQREIQRLRREQNALNDRLAEIETRPTEGKPRPLEPSAAASARATESAEEETKVIRGRHERWKALHANEARDTAWARDEETAFNATLGGGAERGGYKIVNIDCRTTLCTAELEWPSYAQASTGYPEALHVDMPGCESAILLEPPADASRPYRATARYDCENSRTGGEP
jgi:hypothetical protein